MKKLGRSLVVGLLVGLLGGPQWGYGAASGNYTDLLPVGAAANTTVISNGGGWSLTTLPVTPTFGDALSRVVTTIYQSTATGTIANTVTRSTFSALVQGNVGTTVIPAAWIATGRSIRVTVRGKYSTTVVAPNWTWELLIGTTTVMSTGATAAIGNQSGQWFSSSAIVTVAASGYSGTVNGAWDIYTASGTTNAGAVLCYSTATASAVSVDLTSQLTVNPRFTWGTAASGNTITANNVTVELLN